MKQPTLVVSAEIFNKMKNLANSLNLDMTKMTYSELFDLQIKACYPYKESIEQ